MPFTIITGDITKMACDAIVNAANKDLKEGRGVCGAVFSAAGRSDLRRECKKLGKCAVGQAVITSGFHLPAAYIIHTVGPIWHGGRQGEAELLAACYRSSLALARRHGLTSIAFPLLSSGVYGYPREAAQQIAVETIREALTEHEMTVYLVLYSPEPAPHEGEKRGILGKLFPTR